MVLHSQPYDSEKILQDLLTDHPDVLAGGTTGGDGDRELLLVRPELPVAVEEGGTERFSLDHLFIDTKAVPVIVEVKRSSDTRIRREVVGQMLDYAANGTVYWSVEDLRRWLDESQSKGRPGGPDGSSGDDAVREFIGGDDVEEFWRSVEANLRCGNVRLVFVGDKLPPELTRIIEFLNEQMSPAEVLGVEVMQYLGEDGTQVLVPSLVGATTIAKETKTGSAHAKWTRETFMASAEERTNPTVVEFFKRLFNHVEHHDGRLNWGSGASAGVSGWFPFSGKSRPVWTANVGGLNPSGAPNITFNFKDLARVDAARVERLVDALCRVECYRDAVRGAAAVEFTGTGSYPYLHLDTLLGSPTDTEAFFEALEVAASE